MRKRKNKPPRAMFLFFCEISLNESNIFPLKRSFVTVLRPRFICDVVKRSTAFLANFLPRPESPSMFQMITVCCSSLFVFLLFLSKPGLQWKSFTLPLYMLNTKEAAEELEMLRQEKVCAQNNYWIAYLIYSIYKGIVYRIYILHINTRHLVFNTKLVLTW